MRKEGKMTEASERNFLESVSEYLNSSSGKVIVAKVLLATLAVGGVAIVGAVAPGLLRVVGQTERFRSSKKEFRSASIGATFSRLKRNGYIFLKKTDDGLCHICLTEKGRRYVSDFTHRLHIKKPLVWDRKWRVVVFDIPIQKNSEHTMFRNEIRSLGFRQIQKSVWAFPYACEDEILFLARRLGIEKSIEIFTVQKMIHEEALRKRFSL